MSKFLLALTVLLLLALVPASAFAQTPTFYCSYNAVPPGNGSYETPWLCSTQQELTTVVNEVCKSTYAILYQTVSTGYYRHTVEDPNDAACKVTSSVFYASTPPDTGVSVPLPAIFGGAALLGLALIAGGWVVYRKRYA
jgi:hypothetical protein